MGGKAKIECGNYGVSQDDVSSHLICCSVFNALTKN